MNDETINEMIIKCPACAVEGIAKSIMKEIEIPHFGKVMETTIQCSSCVSPPVSCCVVDRSGCAHIYSSSLSAASMHVRLRSRVRTPPASAMRRSRCESVSVGVR